MKGVSMSSRQQGAALMVMCVILVLAACWWLVSTYAANFDRTALDREHNARVLSRAKHALIGYVAHRVNHPANPLAAREAHPGRLPCPEVDANIGTASEGEAAGVCTLPAVGRLPWKTLGIDKLTDASGEPLWYVVSEGWTLTPTATPLALNSNTRGQLTVDGLANAAAALLIAPGAALSIQGSANCTALVQARSAPAPGIDLRNYLDCQNATSPADSSFATAGPSGSFNDQVLAVSAADIWSIVEGAVAARLVRDVLPTLQDAFAAYSDAQWGGSAAAPILPFAQPFADNSMQPYQGALPLWRSQGCTATGPNPDPWCDPNFVHWAVNDPDPVAYPNPSAVKSVFGSRTANISGTPNCVSSSTSQVVSCTISYSEDCGGGLNLAYVLGGTCYLELQVSVRARAKNVGRALRAFTTDANPVFVDGSPWPLVSHAAPINNTGAAAADIRIELPPASCTCFLVLCLLFPCNASNTVTVTVPIGIFRDHPALTTLFNVGTDSEWFTKNRWYETTYYAAAPRHAPDGSPHDCRPANCLTVSGGSLPGDVRALIGMTGYSLSGLARPNANFSDYLDSTANRDGNTAFEQKLAGRSFNDRFFAVSKY